MQPNAYAEDGLKHDTKKPPLTLLDPSALTEIAWVLHFGAEKYGRHNWRGGIRYTRLLDAAMRHLLAINRGEDTDPESGLPHAAHAGCCIMFLIWMMQNRPDLDDRHGSPATVPVAAPVAFNKPPTVTMRAEKAEIEAGLAELVGKLAPAPAPASKKEGGDAK